MSAVITTVEQLRTALPANADMKLDSLTPYLPGAEAQVARLIGGGHSVIDDLLKLSVFTTVQDRALTHLRRAVGNLAVAKALPILNVQISDAGILRQASGQQGDAFQWQYEALLQQVQSEGWEAIEDLLTTLESTPTDFPKFVLPPATLIGTAQIWNQYYFTDGSARIFRSLLPTIHQAQTRQIVPFLTRQGLAVATLTDEELDTARQALVYATLALALRQRQIMFTEQGIQLLSRNDGPHTGTTQTPATDTAQIETLIRYYQALTSQTLEALVPVIVSSVAVVINPVRGDKIVGF